MDLMNSLSGILKQYSNVDPSQPSPNVDAHFDTVAQSAPPDTLAQGISAAFRSDQTPAFGQMVANMFSRSDPGQKAGMLSQLLGAAGPGLVSRVLGGTALGGILGSGQVTPQAASEVSPEAVSQLATEAHKQNPSIVDIVSGFYAQHPTLVKGLGAAALAIAMSHMSKRAA
jgi:hypothetical protein